ncbi:MAG: type II secretion system inner membrane protein GspF [Sideroxydans sp.]|nr:type II secretion system inner membrane protein GspF [Sideroxydans sp.]
MAAFHYQAVDSDGKPKQGLIEADSARAARNQLRDSSLFVVELETVNESRSKPQFSFARRRLSLSDVSLLLRQLATLLEAGLPLEQSMSVLIEQSNHPYQRSLLASMRADVLAGNTLAHAMAQHPRDFPEIHRSLVKAGEASGELANVMDKLATYSENQQALQQKVGLAFVYPAIITVVATIIVGGLLFYVVPQVISVFQQSHQALPWLTRSLILVTDVLAATWIYLLAIILAAAYTARQMLKQETVRAAFHRKLLRLPVVGRLIQGVNTARMASTLSILFGSGVPLLTAMSAASGVVGNLPMRYALEDAAQKVREGVSLSRALASSGLFPPVLIHLIASGEKSGKLDTMLDRVAKQQDLEVSGFVSVLTSLLEPLLILAMGAVVLIIVLAILMPIIQMNQLVK